MHSLSASLSSPRPLGALEDLQLLRHATRDACQTELSGHMIYRIINKLRCIWISLLTLEPLRKACSACARHHRSDRRSHQRQRIAQFGGTSESVARGRQIAGHAAGLVIHQSQVVKPIDIVLRGRLLSPRQGVGVVALDGPYPSVSTDRFREAWRRVGTLRTPTWAVRADQCRFYRGCRPCRNLAHTQAPCSALCRRPALPLRRHCRPGG